MLPAMVMLLSVASEATNMLVPTYQFHDPITGVSLTCNRCPPGYHMHAHCSATRQTQCVPCKPRHFTQHWNYLSKCLYCNKFCQENEFVKQECSPLNNRVCECRENYYDFTGFCTRHRKCPSGQGVVLKGTAHSDTVCQRCSPGTYSSNSSAHEQCKDHTDCAALGLQIVIKGTVWHDNVCDSCEDLKVRGDLGYLKEIFLEFFARQQIKPNKANRFMRHLLSKNSKDRLSGYASDLNPPHFLKNQFRAWVIEASENRLKMLPEFLRKFRAYNSADKLERKIKQVEDFVKLCNSTT